MIFDDVDERIDAAVHKDRNDSEVVERTGEVDVVAQVEHEIVDLVASPAGEESETHGEQRFDDVVFGVYHFTGCHVTCRDSSLQHSRHVTVTDDNHDQRHQVQEEKVEDSRC